MRDKKRIDRIIEALREKWQANPDLRFTQLVINIAGTQQNIWYLDDYEFEEQLKNFGNTD